MYLSIYPKNVESIGKNLTTQLKQCRWPRTGGGLPLSPSIKEKEKRFQNSAIYSAIQLTDVSTTCTVVIFRVKVSCVTSVDGIGFGLGLLTWPGLLEAWLVLTSVKYHGNLYILIPLNQRLALTRLRATGPCMATKCNSRVYLERNRMTARTSRNKRQQQSRVFFEIIFDVYTHVDNRERARASDCK